MTLNDLSALLRLPSVFSVGALTLAYVSVSLEHKSVHLEHATEMMLGPVVEIPLGISIDKRSPTTRSCPTNGTDTNSPVNTDQIGNGRVEIDSLDSTGCPSWVAYAPWR